MMEMKGLAEKLNKKRIERKSFNFDLPEPEVVYNQKGELEGIIKSEFNEAHNLIEEFMLQANEVIGRFLLQKGVQSLFRIHEEPDRDSLHEPGGWRSYVGRRH